MDARPLVGANITQTLFMQDEKLIPYNHTIATNYQNLSSLSGINSMPSEIDDMNRQMPAFVAQAHLSTYYQDAPWNTLTASARFGLPIMGGNLDPVQGPGSRPGNILRRFSPVVDKSNMKDMITREKEHFSGGDWNIKWRQ